MRPTNDSHLNGPTYGTLKAVDPHYICGALFLVQGTLLVVFANTRTFIVLAPTNKEQREGESCLYPLCKKGPALLFKVPWSAMIGSSFLPL